MPQSVRYGHVHVRRPPAGQLRLAVRRRRPPTVLPPARATPSSLRRSCRPRTCRRRDAAGRHGGGPTEPPKAKRRKPIRKILGVLVLAWIVFLVAVPVWAWGKIDKVDAEPGGARPGDQPGTTYLLVGSDSRRGLTKAEQKELSTGGDGGGRGRTDTIMLLHTGDGPSVLMSIPRDSLVDDPRLRPHQDQRRLRLRRPQAAGQDDRAQHRHPDRRLRRGRLRRTGQGRRLPRRRRDLPQGRHQGQGLRPRRQEGLPERRRQDRAGVLAQPALVRDAGHPARAEPARGARLDRQRGQVAVDRPQPVPLPEGRRRRVRLAARSARTSARSRWPSSRSSLSSAMSGKGLNCTVPLRDFAVTWDPERAPKMFDLIARTRPTDDRQRCAPRTDCRSR